MSDLKILAGLGNPGRRYAETRHNVGFMIAERIADRYGFSTATSKFQARVSLGRIDGGKCLALKPMTFMNESGRAIAAACHFYRLDSDTVYVIHDDIDLEPGRVRVKTGGSHGGHNGLKNIDAYIGRAYHRIRIGIGHPNVRQDVNPHVMGDFTRPEKSKFTALIDEITTALPCLLAGDKASFLQRVNAQGVFV